MFTVPTATFAPGLGVVLAFINDCLWFECIGRGHVLLVLIGTFSIGFDTGCIA